MGRALLVLANAAIREKAIRWVQDAPADTRLTFQGPRRSLDQNSRQWWLLTALSERLVWHGQRYTPDEWKEYMLHAFRKARWMPSEDGGMIPIGMSSANLSKEESADFLTLIEEFVTRHGVHPDDDPEDDDEAGPE